MNENHLYIVMFGETVLFASLCSYPLCQVWQIASHDCLAISLICLSNLRAEVMFLSSLEKRADLLTDCYKSSGFPKLSALQMWCKLTACVASTWVYHVILWQMGTRRTNVNMLTLMLLSVLWAIKTIFSSLRLSCVLLASMK